MYKESEKESMSNLQLNQVKDRFIFLSPTVQAGKERECNLSDFEKLGLFGKGAFGEVFKVRHKLTKKVYALKQISKRVLKEQRMVSQMRIEIKIMYSLDHPNIIRLYNHFEDNENVYLIIEVAPGGQLYEKLTKLGRFDERTAQQYTRDVVSAIEYCHNKNPPIIHRDIKPENVLIDKDGKLKLADFGWSNFSHPDATRGTYCGTPDYLAPEMILETGHDASLDIWCIGVLIFEMLAGRSPFAPPSDVKDPKEMQRRLEENILKVKLDFPKDFPALAKDLVTKILKRDPKSRLKMHEIKAHPWLGVVKPSQTIQPEIESTAKSGRVLSNGEQQTTDTSNSHSNTSMDSSPTKSNSGSKVQVFLEDSWSQDELETYSKRKDSIMHSGTNTEEVEEEEPKQKTKVDEMFERFSLKNQSKDTTRSKEIEELNKTIKQLRSQIGEQEIALRTKATEIETIKKDLEKLKNGSELSASGKTLELNKYRLMEEENKKLKKELADMFKALDEKETLIQSNKNEIKKIEELKKSIERAKNEKNQLIEENKKLTASLNKALADADDLKAEKEAQKIQYEKKIKEIESQAVLKGSDENQTILKDLLDFTKKSMKEMQEKIDFYKAKSDKLEELQTRNNELEKQLIRSHADNIVKIEQVKSKIQEQFEAKLEEIEANHRRELQEVREKHGYDLSEKETEFATFATRNSLTANMEKMIESLKSENKLANTIISDLKVKINDLEKIRDYDKSQITRLKQENDDLKMRTELFNRSYKQ